MIWHTIDDVMESNINDWLISTDIKKLCGMPGIYLKRPPELAQDNTPMLPVIQHAVNEYEKMVGTHVDAVVLLQPTSPLRTAEDIDRAIQLFKDSNADSLYSGYYMGIKHKARAYDKHTEKPHFQRNGAIFIARRELIDQGKLWSDNVIEFEMPKSRSIDIDDMDDMLMAEAILKHREAVR